MERETKEEEKEGAEGGKEKGRKIVGRGERRRGLRRRRRRRRRRHKTSRTPHDRRHGSRDSRDHNRHVCFSRAFRTRLVPRLLHPRTTARTSPSLRGRQKAPGNAKQTDATLYHCACIPRAAVYVRTVYSRTRVLYLPDLSVRSLRKIEIPIEISPGR